jgi:hypothetical protein
MTSGTDIPETDAVAEAVSDVGRRQHVLPPRAVPAYDPTKAGRVGARVDIVAVELTSASFSRTDDSSLPGTPAQEQAVTPEFGINAEWTLSGDSQLLGCLLTFATTSESAPYSLVAKFRLVYHINPGDALSHDDIENFVHWNAVFNAWPYWREYLSSTVNRANLPRLYAPIMRLPIEAPASGAT